MNSVFSNFICIIAVARYEFEESAQGRIIFEIA